MAAFWFGVVSVMLAVYVVLDGFDFGVGVVHRLVAKTDEERRTVFAAIGPFWDGNEVWLLAGGGVLFFAFPKAYSAAFSGFYLPLMIVLWLLILRGISIEFRSHVENRLWREFWDSIFVVASALLALVLGTALANVVRGVPLDHTGYFAIPLFTNFQPSPQPGAFDWYTLLVGLFALLLLAGHGLLFLVWKTSGDVQARARNIARNAWLAVVPFWIVVTAATAWLRWSLFTNLIGRPWAWILVVLIVVGLVAAIRFQRRASDRNAFLSSCLFIVGLLAATMAGLYPDLLPSSLDPAASLGAMTTATSEYGMRVGMTWWCIGIALASVYFIYLFWSFAGKRTAENHEEGY
jgi:cytochrome bd ubiquinol oxidase subunit II